jgi:hypothetical protein
MPARFICPACWHYLDCDESWIGKSMKCPQCHTGGKVIQAVPNKEEDVQEVPKGYPPPMPQPSPPPMATTRPDEQPEVSRNRQALRRTLEPDPNQEHNIAWWLGIICLVLSAMPVMGAILVPDAIMLFGGVSCVLFVLALLLLVLGGLIGPVYVRSRVLRDGMKRLGDPVGCHLRRVVDEMGEPNGRRRTEHGEVFTWSARGFRISLCFVDNVCTAIEEEFHDME